MRQLIPRLLRRLNARSLASEKIRPLRPRAKGPKSLRKQLPPVPVFFGRSRSILLDDVNPIMHSMAYRRHKSLPPQVRLPDSQKETRTVSRDGTVEDDVRREMTVEEREWWANPYLRMLSTPIRRCVQSSRYLPSDFLVRLSVKRLPSPRTRPSRPAHTLLPDGLQHPKYKGLDSGQGHYVVCRRAAMQEFYTRGSGRLVSKLPPTLPAYIGHLLRLRILQELELLIERVQACPQGADESPLLRRLSWREFSAVRTGKPLQDQDAVAILVVPPLNRDPTTKMRPVPSTSPLPPEQPSEKEGQSTLAHQRDPLPISTMCHVLTTKGHQPEGLPDIMISMKVPLYNGIALFPSRPQRAALHERLCKLLMVERRARWRQHGPTSTSVSGDDSPVIQRPKDVASPAFLLRSGPETVLRGDTVPLVIALWRLRMWEGDSWERGEGTWATIKS